MLFFIISTREMDTPRGPSPWLDVATATSHFCAHGKNTVERGGIGVMVAVGVLVGVLVGVGVSVGVLVGVFVGVEVSVGVLVGVVVGVSVGVLVGVGLALPTS